MSDSWRERSKKTRIAASSPSALATRAYSCAMPCSIVRSAPPEKVALPEVTTAPLIAASAATLSTSPLSSSIASGVSTFIDRPGMSQVISATPSASTSKRKFCVVIGLSPIAANEGKGVAVRTAFRPCG